MVAAFYAAGSSHALVRSLYFPSEGKLIRMFLYPVTVLPLLPSTLVYTHGHLTPSSLIAPRIAPQSIFSKLLADMQRPISQGHREQV